MSITYLAFLQGMFAAACLLGIGAALAVMWCDVEEKRRENDRADKVWEAIQANEMKRQSKEVG